MPHTRRSKPLPPDVDAAANANETVYRRLQEIHFAEDILLLNQNLKDVDKAAAKNEHRLALSEEQIFILRQLIDENIDDIAEARKMYKDMVKRIEKRRTPARPTA